MECSHEWRRVHEESLIGGHYPVGYECRLCGKFINQSEIGPAGLPGTDTGENVLVGPHGGQGNTSTGERYRKQILHSDGRLEIIR